MSPKKKRSKSCKKRIPSTGQLNRAADALLHPHIQKNPWIILLGGGIHMLIEENPRLSAKKFAKYNLPEIIELLLKRE